MGPGGGLDTVTRAVLVSDEAGGVRLRLNVGLATEDLLLFGQAPCSPGRMKLRRVYYLGFLGPATNGQCDITALYRPRFGQPGPGRKVLIVNRRSVPCLESCKQPYSTETRRQLCANPYDNEGYRGNSPPAAPKPSRLPVAALFVPSRGVHHMHTGCTSRVQRVYNAPRVVHALCTRCTRDVHAVCTARWDEEDRYGRRWDAGVDRRGVSRNWTVWGEAEGFWSGCGCRLRSPGLRRGGGRRLFAPSRRGGRYTRGATFPRRRWRRACSRRHGPTCPLRGG